MKKALWILSSLALAGFAFVGCDEDSNDACDGKCDADTQVCAPIKDAGHACVDTSKLSGKECFVDGAIVAGSALEKNSYGDYICVKDDGGQGQVAKTCEDDSACPDKQVCDVKTKKCETSIDYHKYVRIDDLSDDAANKGKNDPGADIDAVVLVKKDTGAKAYAKRVVSYTRGENLSSVGDSKIYAADSSKILGEPDSLINYGQSADADVCYYYADKSTCAGNKKCDNSASEYCGKTENATNCNLDNKDGADYLDFNYTFVSLGGNKGAIVVEMGDAIEEGDKLDIIEIGHCKLTNTGSKKAGEGFASNDATAENMKVSFSVSTDAQSFKAIGQGTANANSSPKGVYSITITGNMINGTFSL
jgi:hypothetical protein